jgi:hypothetical protein
MLYKAWIENEPSFGQVYIDYMSLFFGVCFALVLGLFAWWGFRGENLVSGTRNKSVLV